MFDSDNLTNRSGMFIPLNYVDEEWKKIIYRDCKEVYYISNFGRVYNIEKGHLMKLKISNSGYREVTLQTKYFGKPITCTVHRLLMIIFNPIEGYEKLFVNHIDGNKTNNYIGNLEWVTPLENIQHAITTGLVKNGEDVFGSKLTTEQVHIICQGLEQGFSYKYISEELLNIIPYTRNMKGMISSIKNGKTWKHISCLYNIPKSELSYGTLLNDKQVNDICLGLQYRLEVDDIVDTLYEAYTDLDIEDRYRIRRIVFNIRRRKAYTIISKHYDF